MHLIEDVSGWRANWFIKYVLAEVPPIGGFFRTEKKALAAHHISKSSLMLLSGVLLMVYDLLKVHMNDPVGVRFGKMTASMIIGMSGGGMLFNGLFAAGSQVKKTCCKVKLEFQEGDVLDSSISVEENDTTWRDYWFVKYGAAEIIPIGGFFKTPKKGLAFQHIAKSTIVLATSVSVMVFHLINVHMNDSNGVRFAKMSVDMIVGMFAGALLYNGLFVTGRAINNYCFPRSSEEDRLLENDVSLNVTHKTYSFY